MPTNTTDGKIMWLTLMHLAFVVSAVMLGFLEKLMSVTSKNDLKDKDVTGGVKQAPPERNKQQPEAKAPSYALSQS